MAKQELFGNRWLAAIIRACDGFPVNRNKPGPGTMKRAVSIVSRGGNLLIFPSGTRSKEPLEAKMGAGFIALRGNAKIVPAVYIGPDHISWRHLFKRPAIQVQFGIAIDTGSWHHADKTSLQEVARAIDYAFERMTCPDAHLTVDEAA